MVAIFNYHSIHITPVVFLDPENVGIALGISSPSCMKLRNCVPENAGIAFGNFVAILYEAEKLRKYIATSS